jgi:hypothetical protein
MAFAKPDQGGIMYRRILQAFLDGPWQDCRLAVRSLQTARTVSIVAILSLALGIGANAAIFSVVDTVLLQTLPVKNPEQLALVADPAAPGQLSYMWSYSVWDQIRRRPHLFEGSFAYFTTRFNLAAGGEAEMVDAYCVSGSFFRVLGIDAALGRTLSDEDDQRGGSPAAGPVAMIGYGFWQTHFGGADVLGRNITVDGQRFTIVGVLPRTFSGPVVGRRSDVVIPVANVPRQGMLKNSGVNWLVIMARLKPGQSREAAAVGLRAEQNSIREGAVLARMPGSSGQQRLTSPLMLLGASHGNEFAPLRRRFQQPLIAMQVIVGFVLLIACANIGNLMLHGGRRVEMR